MLNEQKLRDNLSEVSIAISNADTYTEAQHIQSMLKILTDNCDHKIVELFLKD